MRRAQGRCRFSLTISEHRHLLDQDGEIAEWFGAGSDVTDRRRAVEQLRESEERFYALFTASPVPFMVLAANPPDFTITAANDAYFAATLTTRETLIGHRLFDVFPDDPTRPGQLGSQALEISLARVLATRTTDAMECVRYDIITPDGGFEPHWWLAINAPLFDAAGNITAIIHQVDRQTELHHAEQALRESETRLRGFAENSADVLWIADRTGTQLEYLSPAFEHVFGEGRERVMSEPGRKMELVHPEDRGQAMSFIPRVVSGEVAISHYRVIHPGDGRIVHLRDTGFPIRDAGGAVTQVAGVVQDVTDIARATAALEAEKERFRTLVEGIPQLVWRACAEGRLTWASPQWLDYTGQSLEESRGWGWLETVHPDDRGIAEQAWSNARPHGRLDVEYRVRRASDETWRWHQTRSVPVRAERGGDGTEGRILEWLGTTTDIEDLKSLQEQQEVLVAELQHRTRNLLAVVRTVAQRSIDPSSGLDEYDARLAALGRVQGFLSRSTTYSVPLADVVQAELEAAGDGASDRVTVNGPGVVLSGETVQVVALALHELATNAVKYGAIAQPSGRLAVAWHIVHDVEGSGRQLVIDWSESGVAMPKGPPVRRGYGSELITRALPYQLRAKTSLEFTPDGVRCRVMLPASAFGNPKMAALP